MHKYLVLYRAPTSAREQMAQASPEQAKAGMDAWMAWATRARDAIVDLGSPLGDAAYLAGGSSSDRIGGFSILQAGSMDTVKKILEEHPHLHVPSASIEVMEFLPMPGR
jgi:hypothetical protein